MDRNGGLELWLRRLSLRTPLAPVDRAAVLALPGAVELVRANHDIVRDGERLACSCLIMSGAAGRYGQTRQGARQYSAFYIAGDMADLHSAMLPHVSYPLAALSNVQVLRVPHGALLDLAARSPAIAHAFWRDCVVDASIAGEWLLNIGQRDARARLAHLLCELALRHEAIGHDRLNFEMPLTQVQLGEALGLTGVHVNRTLRALREAGLVEVSDGRVRIPDWNALVYAADFDPLYLHLDLQRVAEAA